MNLPEEIVRKMVRLLGETAALSGGISEKKRHLMDGLCTLIQADAWVWSLGCQIRPDEPQVFVGFLHGGFSEERFARYLKAVEHPDMAQIASRFAEEISRENSHITMRREEIDTTGLAALSEAGPLWEQADIGSLMLSGYPLDAESFSTVGFYRALGVEPFTDLEKKIAHIILSEVPWLHQSGWPEDRGATVPQLYPRQRIVLNLLLDGLSQEQISSQMGITDHTVSGYTMAVYRHFGVTSHVELMRKFLHAE